ncbi:hypothetical protein [Rhodobacter xanthinilyticus]|uniref:hypothetical protein n=1 Tax=Rhodobacter xanthinilyticus TaxID=1850250 RepID=UPI001E3604CD|nr:hypothetical protein [Rhodobacter xanthinilyticus]
MTIPDVSSFRSGRDYAALLDVTPRSHSSGAREGWDGSRRPATATSIPGRHGEDPVR